MVEFELVTMGGGKLILSFSEITEAERALLGTPAGDTQVQLRMMGEAMQGQPESMLIWAAIHVGSYLGKIKAESEPKKLKTVYMLRVSDGRFKIGVTKNLKNRIASIRTGAGVDVAAVVSCPGTRDDEQRLLSGLGVCRIAGEWFAGAPLLHIAMAWISSNGRVPSSKEIASICSAAKEHD